MALYFAHPPYRSEQFCSPVPQIPLPQLCPWACQNALRRGTDTFTPLCSARKDSSDNPVGPGHHQSSFLGEKPWTTGGAGEGCTSEGAGGKSACTIPFCKWLDRLCCPCWPSWPPNCHGCALEHPHLLARSRSIPAVAFRCLWVAGSAVAMATLPLPSILETSTRQRGSEQKAAQVLGAQPAVEGHSFSTYLGPCWTKQQCLGLGCPAVQELWE